MLRAVGLAALAGITVALLIVGARLDGSPGASATQATERIAFVSQRDGNFELYLMGKTGQNQTRITSDAAFDHDPSWGCNELLFVSDRAGSSDIWSATFGPGGTPTFTQITTDPAPEQSPSASCQNQDRIFARDMTGTFAFDIFARAPDGTERNLTQSPSSESQPAISPDGTRIAYSRVASLHLMNKDGSDQHAITQAAIGTGHGSPEWSPDGTKIIFNELSFAPDGSLRYRLRMIDLGVPNPQPVSIFSDDISRGFASFSPDGTKIAYARSVTGQDADYDVWVANADGTGETQLTGGGVAGAREAGRAEGAGASGLALFDGEPVWGHLAEGPVGGISILKFEEGSDQPLSGWQFNIYRGPDCSGEVVTSTVTGDNGAAELALPVGAYSAQEKPQAGWTNVNSLCQDVVAGGVVSQRIAIFVNERVTPTPTPLPTEGPLATPTPIPPNTVVVEKVDHRDRAIAGWQINLHAGGESVFDCSGPIVETAVTDANGRVVFDDLALPAYSVSEKPRPGWSAVATHCVSLGDVGGESGRLVRFGNYPPRLGDVNCDRRVDAVDAALYFQLIARLIVSVPCPDTLDVNGDGNANSIDVALILQYGAGLVGDLGYVGDPVRPPVM